MRVEGLSQVAWHENGGSQSFSSHTITTLLNAHDVRAADIDSDGDIDALAASPGINTVAGPRRNWLLDAC